MKRTVLAAAALVVAGLVAAADLDVSIRGASGRPAPDVVVMLFPAGAPAAPPARSVDIVQQGNRFEPYVTAVPAGTAVRFVNRDRYDHHVRSLGSGPMGAVPPVKSFELRLGGVQGGAKAIDTLTFEAAGTIRRLHQGRALPGPATGQGARPLRHGARRHRRHDLGEPGLPGRALPDHRRGRTALPDRTSRRRLGRWTPGTASTPWHRDEGREPVHGPPAQRHAAHARSHHRARPDQGHEDPPGQRHRGADGHLLGGTNVQVSAPEARDALEKGVADAITFPWNFIISFGIDKVTKFHTDLRLYAASFVWVMNKGWYDKLGPARRR
jgi:plastocyanin